MEILRLWLTFPPGGFVHLTLMEQSQDRSCDASCLTITSQTFILYDGGEHDNWWIQHEH